MGRSKLLKITEIEELKNGTWELDCPKMTLCKNSKKDVDVYKGGGYIRREPDGGLRFKLYSERQLDIARVLNTPGISGKLIDDQEYYELSATDAKGRIWKSDHILPEPSGCAGETGVVVYGKLWSLAYTSQNRVASSHKHNSLNIIFFHNFKVPCNTGTKTSVTIGGKIRKQNSSLDTAQFNSCGCEFEIKNENEMVALNVFSKNTLPPNLEIRAVESLQFVMGIPLEWVVMQKTENNVETIYINRVSTNQKKAKIGPPINPKDLRNTTFVWKLYDKYLNYIIKYEEKHKYHPISVFVAKVLRGSEGSIDPMMLTLGIAIEGVLRKAYPELTKLPQQEYEELKKAQQIIEESSLNEKFKSRLRGVMDSWANRSAADMLHSLVELGVINREEVNAWKEIRNPTAHAALPDSSDLQKLIDLCHTVTVLFYKLIFHAIGYQGKYTNYGLYGWLLDDYPKAHKSQASDKA